MQQTRLQTGSKQASFGQSSFKKTTGVEMQSEFARNPFAGRGDNRIIAFKTDLNNAVNAVLMVKYLVVNYEKKDDQLETTEEQLAQTEARLLRSSTWTHPRWAGVAENGGS